MLSTIFFFFKLLIFLLKYMSKSIVIRSLKRSDGLDLFTRLEKLSSKQINSDGSNEFLRPCQSFDLTPTFAKIDETKSKKWTRSSAEFTRNVIVEELRNNSPKNITLKKQISEIYSEIRQNWSNFRYLCVMRTMALLRKKAYQKMSEDYSSKICTVAAQGY